MNFDIKLRSKAKRNLPTWHSGDKNSVDAPGIENLFGLVWNMVQQAEKDREEGLISRRYDTFTFVAFWLLKVIFDHLTPTYEGEQMFELLSKEFTEADTRVS